MIFVKKIKKKVRSFFSSVTFKRRQLVVAAFFIFLNCLSWKKVDAKSFPVFKEFDNSKSFFPKKEIQGATGKDFNNWQFSTDNFFWATEAYQKHKHGFSSNKYIPDWNKAAIPASFNQIFEPDFFETIYEAEKLRKKKNKFNVGGMVLSGLKIFGSTFSFSSKTQIKPRMSGFFESFALSSMLNPDSQSFYSSFLLYPEIKMFHDLENSISDDSGKGFVVGKIGANSGSDLSREIIIQQKISGYNTVKNLKDAFMYQQKVSSDIFRKDTDCVDRNKVEDMEKWDLTSLPEETVTYTLNIPFSKVKPSREGNDKAMLFSKGVSPLKNNEKHDSNEETISASPGNFSSFAQEKRLYKFDPDYKIPLFEDHIQYEDIDRVGCVNLSILSRPFKKNPRYKKLRMKYQVDFDRFLKAAIIDELELNAEDLTKIQKRTKFGKKEGKDLISNSPSENYLSFSKDFILEGLEIDSFWNFSKISFFFHLHNLSRSVKKFITTKKIQKKKYLFLQKKKGDQNLHFLISGKNLKGIPSVKSFCGEFLESKKSLEWEEEKKEDSVVSHLKESFELIDDLGFEFFSKVFTNGINFPKSNFESAKLNIKASMIGNLDAQNTLGFNLFQGKGVPRNRNISAKVFNSAAKLGHLDSIFDASLVIEKGVQGKGDTIRAFNLNKMVSEFGGEEKIVSKKISKKEKVDLSKIFFSSLIEPTETGMLRCFSGSLFFRSMSFIAGTILERGEKISSAINYQNKTVSENSFNSVLASVELFWENRQIFLAVEKSKLSKGLFFPIKTGIFYRQKKRTGSLFDVIVGFKSFNGIHPTQSLLFLSTFNISIWSTFQLKIIFAKFKRVFVKILTGNFKKEFSKIFLMF